MLNLSTYYIIRRRIAKAILKLMGWKFRGQDQPSSHPHIIFINHVEAALSKSQTKWMPYLTVSASSFLELNDLVGIQNSLTMGNTVLIRWIETPSNSDLVKICQFAKDKGARISACAWDTTHKSIKFHSQFKPSPYPERDIRYLGRFFIYFKTV